jgi:hypothetical protein
MQGSTDCAAKITHRLVEQVAVDSAGRNPNAAADLISKCNAPLAVRADAAALEVFADDEFPAID